MYLTYIYIYIKCSLEDQACYRSILDPGVIVLVFVEKPSYGSIRIGRTNGQGLRTLRSYELEVWSIAFGRTTCTRLFTPSFMVHLVTNSRAHCFLMDACASLPFELMM